ncbi:MAG TPA: antitoxin Xre/MbcA/ParS toxin-binding domain-containing protein [Candidatus Elarobacter sp.]|nr:antitoxin Xre/MbcA/ParS toxin-binding domain-containing protein [Candidatus Elarobacter sp.]
MSALPATIVTQVDARDVGRLLHSEELAAAQDARSLHAEISRGLPAEVLDGLREIGYSVDEIARVTANSARTVQRYLADRRRRTRLNLATSDRAVRLAAVTVLADRLIGRRDLALAWLRAPNQYLGGLTPLEMLESDAGTAAVVQSLYTIAYGGVA